MDIKKYLFTFVIFLGFFGLAHSASAATEFISVVDTGSGTGYDYSSLYDWEAAMTNTALDLTSVNTKVFSGSITGSISDNTTVYQCRSGVYQSVSGSMVRDTAAGQALVKTITGGAGFQANDRWYTNNTCNSAGYFTISNTGDSAIAVAKCRATTGAADTAAVTVDGWTTGSSNYIKIWTDPSENYRHDGKWDDNKYRLEYSALGGWSNAIVVNDVSYVRIEGLQIYFDDNAYSNTEALRAWSDNITEGLLVVRDNIARGAGNTEGPAGSGLTGGSPNQKAVFVNNIVYDFNGYGIDEGEASPTNSFLYNNTAYNCGTGFHISGVLAINNAAFNNSGADFYSGEWTDPSSTNNASSDGTADDGLLQNGIVSLIASNNFVDATNRDFHLKLGAGLIDSAVSLASDSNLRFSDDIDGQERPGTWDIGADELIMEWYNIKGTVKLKGDVKFK